MWSEHKLSYLWLAASPLSVLYLQLAFVLHFEVQF